MKNSLLFLAPNMPGYTAKNTLPSPIIWMIRSAGSSQLLMLVVKETTPTLSSPRITDWQRHGLIGKQNLYEHSMPFFIRDSQGKVITAPIYLQDAMATSLAIAGSEASNSVEFQKPSAIGQERQTHPNIRKFTGPTWTPNDRLPSTIKS